MLATRIGTLRSAHIPRTLAKPCSIPPCAIRSQFRTYALSRFDPERRPGVGRVRPKVTPVSSPRRTRDPSYPSEEPFSTSEAHRAFETDLNSPLWEASQRVPTSDPEQGLKTLLMDNDLLVITRCVVILECIMFWNLRFLGESPSCQTDRNVEHIRWIRASQ